MMIIWKKTKTNWQRIHVFCWKLVFVCLQFFQTLNLHARVHVAINNTRALVHTNISNNYKYYQLYESPPAVTRLTVYCRAHISLVGLNRSSKNMCGRFCCCLGKTGRCLAHKIIILEHIHDFACFQIQINFWLGSLDSEPTNVYYR